MKILLAPSENKIDGGDKIFDISSLLFKELLPLRNKLLHKYINILQRGNFDELSKLFGIKNKDKISCHIKDIINEPCIKAIERYSGVAFDKIEYNQLDMKAKEYIDNNLLIFSNLWGVLKANDLIPNYKLKQNEDLGDIRVDKFYKEELSNLLDNYLKDEEILDLRSTHYNKFYIPNKNYYSVKILKDNKVVSHWAKAYRGIIVNEIAKHNINSIDELMKHKIKNLELIEIKIIKNKKEILYKVI